MPKPIEIDLRRDLTPEVMARARPHIGDCDYRTCIVGQMLPPAARDRFNNYSGEYLPAI